MYRIGSQVHDHEARIRLLEHDSVALTEGMKHVQNTLADVCGGIRGLDDKLDSHTTKEDRDRSRLFTSSWAQFLALIVGLAWVLVEKSG